MKGRITLSVLAVMVFGLLISAPAANGMNNTLLCSCDDKRYDTPDQLLPKCTRPVLTRPMCGAMLPVDKQECSVFKREPGFKAAYDAVVLGRKVTPSLISMGMRGQNFSDYAALVGYVIDTFYKPWTRGDVSIEVMRGAAEGGEYAKVEKIFSTRIAFIVRGAVFRELSPAAFITKIGHEMIHVEQVKREYRGVQFALINDIVAAMNELEASSWETSSMQFNWKIKPNQLLNCQTNREREFADAVRKCRDWQVQELLIKVNTNRSVQDNFAKWIDQNSWAKNAWLPRNANWRGVTRNNKLSQIPIPSDPGRAFDCRDTM